MKDNLNTETESTSLSEAPVESFNDFVDTGVDESPVTTAAPGEPPATAAPDSSVGGGAPVAVPPGVQATPSAPPVQTPGAAAPGVPPIPPAAAAPAGQSPAAPATMPGAPAAPGAQPDLLQMREGIVAEIAQRYAMPDAVRDQFLLNPEQVLPTMAARLYVDVFEAVLQTVMGQIPQLMSAREQQVRVAQTTEQKFFERWPALRDPQYAADIAAIGRSYRQQNPQATFEQAMEAVGAMVSVAKSLPLPGITPSAPPQMRPPSPIGPGAARGSAPAAPAQDNPWSDIFSND